MNILVIAPSTYIDGTSGDSTHLRELVTNLSKNNKLILVARSHKRKILCNSFNFKRVVNITLPRFDLFSSSIHAFLLGLIIIRTSKVHVIYERNHIFGSGIFLAKLKDIPSVIEVNGLTSEEADSAGYYGPIMQKIVKKIETNVFFNASKIVVVTKNLKHVIHDETGIPLKKMEIVANAANTELFEPMNSIMSRKELNMGVDNCYICFVGNLIQWQGVEYLIKAAPHILKSCPDARFLIIGDGQMKNEWVQLAEDIGVSDKFIFIGSVPYKEVPLHINASDVCVAPFIKKRNEKIGLSPLKLYEYMACGKPVVASNIKGVGEILEREKAGIAISLENPDEFAIAIIKLLQNEKIRTQMGSNGREYVLKNHSWASVAEKVEKLCRNTIADYDIK